MTFYSERMDSFVNYFSGREALFLISEAYPITVFFKKIWRKCNIFNLSFFPKHQVQSSQCFTNTCVYGLLQYKKLQLKEEMKQNDDGELSNGPDGLWFHNLQWSFLRYAQYLDRAATCSHYLTIRLWIFCQHLFSYTPAIVTRRQHCQWRTSGKLLLCSQREGS